MGFYKHTICIYAHINIRKGETVVEIFKALSEESRLRILALLMVKEMCVCEIEIYLKMTQSNASRHLTTLKKSGILNSYKNAQWAYYSISEHFKEEHKGLWEYIQNKIVELPTYQIDYKEYEKYKNIDVCAKANKPD